MTAGECIESPESLDRDRDIWLVYDGVYASEPKVAVYEEDEHPDSSVKKGDYVINAW